MTMREMRIFCVHADLKLVKVAIRRRMFDWVVINGFKCPYETFSSAWGERGVALSEK
jgi:hypothetical protein